MLPAHGPGPLLGHGSLVQNSCPVCIGWGALLTAILHKPGKHMLLWACPCTAQHCSDTSWRLLRSSLGLRQDPIRDTRQHGVYVLQDTASDAQHVHAFCILSPFPARL